MRDGRGSTAVISVVFSFFNEEAVLPELLRRTRAVFDGLIQDGQVGGYELIFVNDASTDRSEEILRRGAAERSDIRLINMSRNFGVSPCVLAGMLYAQGDAVIYMDADLQDPPEVIPELVRVWQSQPDVDVVHTVRRSRAGETRVKLAVTRLGYRLLRMVSTIDLPLEAGDFKLLSRRAVNLVTQFREKRPFLRGLVCWIGLGQAKVHYHREARWSGKTKFHVLGPKVIRNFIDSAIISFSDVPLKISTALGLLFSLGAFAYLALVVARWWQGDHVPEWSPVLAVLLFLGGVQLISVGILGTYIASIFLESKGRPNFIIRDVQGFSFAEPSGGDHRPWHEARAEAARLVRSS
ncbi:MAG TPA: glycosyltransferase family 2 protein [Pirellulales bacterium]|jgi:dolichol-phosphate mannosyltransferase|nr:glycosyltransferase family 2 protein [Pirellulales bacterium]